MQHRQPGIGSGIVKLFTLFAASYVFAMFQGGFVSWFLLYSCLVLVIYEAFTYLLMFAKLEVSREIDRDRLKDGEDVLVTLRLKRKIGFPLGWYIITEPLPERLAGLYEAHRQLVFPWFKREMVIHYVIPDVKRGYYQLTDCVVSAGDYFGFLQRTQTYRLSNSFLVYPSHRSLALWTTSEGRISGNIQSSQRHSDDVAAVRGVRDYQRGDRLTQIHWRASARGLGLKSKEFEHQATNQVIFFLDACQESYQGQDPELFETAVKLTASLVYYTSKRRYPYGFITHHKERISIPIANTHTQFFRVFDQLARVEPTAERSFASIISREALEYASGVTLTVITPLLEPKLVAHLAELSRMGRNIHFFWIHSHSEISLKDRQALRFLAAGRVVTKSLHLNEYENLSRIGGA